jgi:serine protease Do
MTSEPRPRIGRLARRAVVGSALALLFLPLLPAGGLSAGERWGWLGVRIRDLTEQESEDLTKRLGIREGYGVLIAQVMKETPAEAAGLREGDLVVAVDGRPIVETRALQRVVGAMQAGQDIALVVLREQARRELKVRVGNMPPEVVADRLALEFGFYVRDVSEGQSGAPSESKPPVVAGVAERSSAARGGLLAGDRILAVNGTEVETIEGFRQRTQALLLRDPIRLRVERKGEHVVLTLPPVQTPSH